MKELRNLSKVGIKEFFLHIYPISIVEGLSRAAGTCDIATLRRKIEFQIDTTSSE